MPAGDRLSAAEYWGYLGGDVQERTITDEYNSQWLRCVVLMAIFGTNDPARALSLANDYVRDKLPEGWKHVAGRLVKVAERVAADSMAERGVKVIREMPIDRQLEIMRDAFEARVNRTLRTISRRQKKGKRSVCRELLE